MNDFLNKIVFFHPIGIVFCSIWMYIVGNLKKKQVRNITFDEDGGIAGYDTFVDYTPFEDYSWLLIPIILWTIVGINVFFKDRKKFYGVWWFCGRIFFFFGLVTGVYNLFK